MAKFARKNEQNIVVELFEHETILPSETHVPEIASQFQPCPDEVEVNWVFDPATSIYSAPIVEQAKEDKIKISAPVATPVSIAFDISVKVEDSEANTVDVTETYYVPIKNITDNATTKMLVIPLVNGQATVSTVLDVVGVYEILKDQIRPVPSAKLDANVSITVY